MLIISLISTTESCSMDNRLRDPPPFTESKNDREAITQYTRAFVKNDDAARREPGASSSAGIAGCIGQHRQVPLCQGPLTLGALSDSRAVFSICLKKANSSSSFGGDPCKAMFTGHFLVRARTLRTARHLSQVA